MTELNNPNVRRLMASIKTAVSEALSNNLFDIDESKLPTAQDYYDAEKQKLEELKASGVIKDFEITLEGTSITIHVIPVTPIENTSLHP